MAPACVARRFSNCAAMPRGAGERRGPYREYGKAFRRTHDTKDPGPSGWVAAGARGVAVLDRIADTPFARLLADRRAATQRSCFYLVPTCSRTKAQ